MIVIQEPLRIDFINADKLSKEYAPTTGQPFTNPRLFQTYLTARMIQSWTNDKKEVVKPADYDKVLIEQATESFVGKLTEECNKLLAEIETEKNSSATLSEQEPKRNSSKA